jgi:methionine-rich copper-binding protein CopC
MDVGKLCKRKLPRTKFIKGTVRIGRVGVAALAFLVALSEASWGHAFPDHSDPKVGSTVNGSPPQVRIWFDSNLEAAFSTVMVHTVKGKMVDKGDGRVNPSDPTLLEVNLPPLPAGTYIVIWSVIARDGHKTNGDYRFTIK